MNEGYGRCVNCDRISGKRRRRGLCATCYSKVGKNFPKQRRSKRPIADRLLERVAAGPNGCWIWTGQINNSGYGIFYLAPSDFHRSKLPHRLAYEEFVGPIPEGLQIDHLCRERRCLNPEHLEPVTPRENTRRSPDTLASRWGSRTHCDNGHEYTPENTIVTKRSDNPEKTYRVCRTCKREYNRARARRQAVTR